MAWQTGQVVLFRLNGEVSSENLSAIQTLLTQLSGGQVTATPAGLHVEGGDALLAFVIHTDTLADGPSTSSNLRAIRFQQPQLCPPRPAYPVADLSPQQIQRRPILSGLISEYERAA